MAHLSYTATADFTADKTMILNMGPQHPSTHGVLRLLLEIDGERVVRMIPDIGYLHTGIEKTCEAKFYQQVVTLTDRIDYLCPMTNNLCYVLGVDEYENLLTSNPIWVQRTKGVAHLSAEDALALGVTGPTLRARGIDWDLRRDMPYSSYEKFQFKVPVSKDADVYARYIVRVQE